MGLSLRQTRPVRFFAGLEEGMQEAWGKGDGGGMRRASGAGHRAPDTRLAGGWVWPRQPGAPWARALARRPRLLSAVARGHPGAPGAGIHSWLSPHRPRGLSGRPLRHTRPPVPGLHGTPDTRALCPCPAPRARSRRAHCRRARAGTAGKFPDFSLWVFSKKRSSCASVLPATDSIRVRRF